MFFFVQFADWKETLLGVLNFNQLNASKQKTNLLLISMRNILQTRLMRCDASFDSDVDIRMIFHFYYVVKMCAIWKT